MNLVVFLFVTSFKSDVIQILQLLNELLLMMTVHITCLQAIFIYSFVSCY